LDSATVYALGLIVIAPFYVGFAVADGRPKVIAAVIVGEIAAGMHFG
jgi:hypothetical protein